MKTLARLLQAPRTVGVAYGQAAWDEVGEPVDPMDNVLRYRAQSMLFGIETRDGDRAPLLPAPQARDVVAWAESRQGWAL